MVATNDAHFLKADDHAAHDVLLCIGLKKDRLDADRMRYDRGLYFKSAPEIAAHFKGHPEVLTNTLAIADQVDGEVREEVPRPLLPAPQGREDGERRISSSLSEAGARKRYGDPLPPEVEERLQLRARRHHEHGVRRLLPDHRRLHPGGTRPGHPGRARAAARRRARSSPTRSGSRTSAPSSSTSSSSASSIRNASRCPTSTSTSARNAAAR